MNKFNPKLTMLRPLLLLSVVLCITPSTAIFCWEGYEVVGKQCLLVFDISEQTIEEARTFCNSIHSGELLKIKDAVSFINVLDMIKEHEDRNYWIDGSLVDGAWVYSDGDAVPMGTPYWGTTELNETNWIQAPGEVSDSDAALVLHADFYHYLMAVEADSSQPEEAYTICETRPRMLDNKIEHVEKEIDIRRINCPLAFVQIGSMCLSLVTWADVDHAEAEVLCQSLNGHLAEFYEIQEFRLFNEYVVEHGIAYDSFWIGGIKQDDVWTWLSRDVNMTMGPPYWGTRGPLEIDPLDEDDANCVGLVAGGFHYFRSVDCKRLMNVLCETT